MIWGLIRGILKLAVAIVIFLAVAGAVAVVLVEWSCRPGAPVTEAASPLAIDDAGYKRTEANTYWTFPEWYIVYSYEDFGQFLETQPESAFPYADHIAGFWSSFCSANRVAGALPGDHLAYKQMIYIIGVSYTIEIGLKGMYEQTIGRLSELFRGPRPTPEDVYARGVVQAYADFLHQIPWYQFPFMEKLAGLWDAAPFVGDSPVRNIERHLSLSAEYLVKAGYAKAIAAAAATTEQWPEDIMFVVRGDVPAVLAAEPDVKLVRTLPDGSALLVAPRYQVFTEIVKRIAAAQSVEIVEIAGNRHILMTAIVPDGPIPEIEGAREMFVLPMSARPGFSRVGYDLDVPRLAAILREYTAANVEVEHLYDY